MKTKLMIGALLFCSSLAFAAEPSRPATAPSTRVKPVKVVPTTSSDQQVDETVLGAGLGTGSSSAPSKKLRRGGPSTAPQLTK